MLNDWYFAVFGLQNVDEISRFGVQPIADAADEDDVDDKFEYDPGNNNGDGEMTRP